MQKQNETNVNVNEGSPNFSGKSTPAQAQIIIKMREKIRDIELDERESGRYTALFLGFQNNDNIKTASMLIAEMGRIIGRLGGK